MQRYMIGARTKMMQQIGNFTFSKQSRPMKYTRFTESHHNGAIATMSAKCTWNANAVLRIFDTHSISEALATKYVPFHSHTMLNQ